MTATGSQRDMARLPGSLSQRSAIPFGRSLGLVLSLLVLTSCAATVPPVSQQPVPPPQTAVAVPLPKVKPVPSDLTRTTRSVANAEPGVASVTEADAGPVIADDLLVAALPDPADYPAPRTTANPNTLVGLDQNQTRRLLGTPASTEELPPAKVWRYAKGECTLKVFFFLDMTSSQDFRALSYDMTSSENVPDIDSRCFAQLIAQAGDVQFER